MMVNDVKYQSHDSFWELGVLTFEEVDLDPDMQETLEHLALLEETVWRYGLRSTVTPRDGLTIGTPRDELEPDTLLSLSYANVSTPSPREESDDGYWNILKNLSLEEMINYVTAR
jgi:hypothetical protein